MFLCYIDPGTGMTILTGGSFFLAMLFSFFGVLMLYFRRIFNFLGKNRKAVIIVIIIILILAIIAGYMLMSGKTSNFNKKIIILGFDGLSPEIIEPMMAKGELPNFSKLKAEGSYSRLQTTNPPQSPVAWAGFATGTNPGKSGLYDFIMRDPKNYSLSLSISNLSTGRPIRPIRNKCFWQYTSDENIPAVVIGCPDTFPPDSLNGRLLSGMGVPDILGTEGTFSLYTSERSPAEIYTGGNVIKVKRSGLIVAYLTGPRFKPLFGDAKNAQVPMKITVDEDKNSAAIKFQDNEFEIKVGEWSGWKSVSFDLGMMRSAKGILRFYLIATKPELKLYASPINMDPRDPLFPISSPGSYSKELAEKIGLFYTQGMPMDTWAVNENVLSEEPLIEQIGEVFKERVKTLDFELARFKEGVLFCYFESSDIVQHMFWRYRDPRHPLYEKGAPEKYRREIETWYQNMDKVLGDVMRKLGKDDTLIVLSDHGFNTFRRAAHLNSWLMKNGYLFLSDPYSESGGELLADVDWTRTKAYAIGFGAIYLNLKGREGKGIVDPADAEKLKDEISSKLGNWVDDKYNERVISKVYKSEEIFHGPLLKEMPDLYAGFNIGYRASWQTALGAVPAGLIEDNLKKWSGDHLFDPHLVPGVLFANKKITKQVPSIYDVTPTIVKIIGFNEEKMKECDFDGRPLF